MLAGVLQLPASTHLTVDATVLQPGQLESQGVHNLRELQGVIAEQTLTLRFPYHEQKLPVGALPTRVVLACCSTCMLTFVLAAVALAFF
jgi:hypothetical protein